MGCVGARHLVPSDLVGWSLTIPVQEGIGNIPLCRGSEMSHWKLGVGAQARSVRGCVLLAVFSA